MHQVTASHPWLVSTLAHANPTARFGSDRTGIGNADVDPIGATHEDHAIRIGEGGSHKIAIGGPALNEFAATTQDHHKILDRKMDHAIDIVGSECLIVRLT